MVCRTTNQQSIDLQQRNTFYMSLKIDFYEIKTVHKNSQIKDNLQFLLRFFKIVFKSKEPTENSYEDHNLLIS